MPTDAPPLLPIISMLKFLRISPSSVLSWHTAAYLLMKPSSHLHSTTVLWASNMSPYTVWKPVQPSMVLLGFRTPNTKALMFLCSFSLPSTSFYTSSSAFINYDCFRKDPALKDKLCKASSSLP